MYYHRKTVKPSLESQKRNRISMGVHIADALKEEEHVSYYNKPQCALHDAKNECPDVDDEGPNSHGAVTLAASLPVGSH